MAEQLCPKCHKTITAADSAAFCPYCGEKLPVQESGLDLSLVHGESDPVKKHEMLEKLLAENPDSLEVAEEILYLGKLYLRGQKGLDFSVIKCYVLNVYLEPDEMKKDRREALRREIFSHPDLDRCLRLTQNKDAFLRRYLQHISGEFIDLFLKGSTRHMRSFFGFVNQSKAPKYLAAPVVKMMLNMQRDETLTQEQRQLLMQSLYAAFASKLGDTQSLDEQMKTYGVTLEAK